MQDFETLSLLELIRLENDLSQVITRRFQRTLAVACSDIVGSTEYFSRFGNEAGNRLQQRHFDFLRPVLQEYDGRIESTAGDGALTYFPTVDQAVDAMIAMQTAISEDNTARARDHQAMVRVGIHYGPVLVDGDFVTGDSLHLCARVTTTAQGAEIRLTREAVKELRALRRLACHALPPAALKGIPEPVETFVLEWRDIDLFPIAFRVQETGEEVTLHGQDIISCGRLKEKDGVLANDMVLALPDRNLTQRISRWHFELRRQPNGLFLRQVSEGSTQVNGTTVHKGQQVPIRAGDSVRVANVMTLTFIAARSRRSPGETTVYSVPVFSDGP